LEATKAVYISGAESDDEGSDFSKNSESDE
jgi:hypothetical protein